MIVSPVPLERKLQDPCLRLAGTNSRHSAAMDIVLERTEQGQAGHALPSLTIAGARALRH